MATNLDDGEHNVCVKSILVDEVEKVIYNLIATALKFLWKI